MKKLMLIVLGAVLVGALNVSAESADATAKTKYIDVGAAQLSYTNTVSYGDLYKNVEQLVFKNASAVTVTATTYVVCGTLNVATIDTSVITAGSSAKVLVTNIAQQVKTVFTLAGTNGVAKASAIEATVFGYGK